MSYKLVDLILKRRFGKGPEGVDGSSRKTIAAVLASFADKTDLCYPSIPSIADRSECSIRTTRRCLREFESERIIEQVGDRPCRSGRVKVWRIDRARIADLPVTTADTASPVMVAGLQDAKQPESPVMVTGLAEADDTASPVMVATEGRSPRPSRPVTMTGRTSKRTHHRNQVSDNSSPAVAAATAVAPAVAAADNQFWTERLNSLRCEFGDVLSRARGVILPDELIAYEARGFHRRDIEQGVRQFCTVHRARMADGWRGRINSLSHPGIAEAIIECEKRNTTPEEREARKASRRERYRKRFIREAVAGRMALDMELLNGRPPTDAELAEAKAEIAAERAVPLQFAKGPPAPNQLNDRTETTP